MWVIMSPIRFVWDEGWELRQRDGCSRRTGVLSGRGLEVGI